MVRALASHQCGSGLIPGLNAICGLSLLLVLFSAREVFLWVLWFSPLLKNQHFQIPIRSGFQWTNSHSVEVPLKFPFDFWFFKNFLCVSNLLLTAPSAPTTTGTTSCCLIPCSCPISLFKFWYLSIFSPSFSYTLWSHCEAISIIIIIVDIACPWVIIIIIIIIIIFT